MGGELICVSLYLPNRQTGLQICDKLTGEPAMFSHAVFYAEGAPPETGNYVPGDEEIPGGLELKNV